MPPLVSIDYPRRRFFYAPVLLLPFAGLQRYLLTFVARVNQLPNASVRLLLPSTSFFSCLKAPGFLFSGHYKLHFHDLLKPRECLVNRSYLKGEEFPHTLTSQSHSFPNSHQSLRASLC